MPTTLPDPSDPEELRAFLEALPEVDADGLAHRARELATPTADPAGLVEAAIRLTDLTTLEGTDTPERVRALAGTALHPDPDDPSCPPVATVCVYSDLVAPAAEVLAGSGVGIAAVAGSFPSGRAPLAVRVADVGAAVAAGATEVDVVLDRGAILQGRWHDAGEQLRALVDACGDAPCKVILETVELGDPTLIRRAAWLALLSGAALVKTSTGKVAGGGATLPHALLLADAVLAHEAAAGRPAGVKASGGVRTAAEAVGYLAMVQRLAGPSWLVPARFRFGASSLLGDLVSARRGHTDCAIA